MESWIDGGRMRGVRGAQASERIHMRELELVSEGRGSVL
jgi:hypothetical protein